MRRYKAVAALVALLSATTALAQDAESFAPTGVWTFRTDARTSGGPVCSEAWDFGPGDRLSVSSGEERLIKQFRIVGDADGLWLVTTTLQTNGLPDCVGNATAILTPGETRTYLVPMNDGLVLTCPAPGRAPNGAPFVMGCYGSISPLAPVG